MFAASTPAKVLLSRQASKGLSRAALQHGLSVKPPVLKLTCTFTQPVRHFSASQQTNLKHFFPPPDSPGIRKTDPAWPHPVYNEKEMNDIVVAHREAKTWSDWVALSMVRILRFSTDLATGYRHDKELAKNAEGSSSAASTPQKYRMSERKWLIRFVFLETVAGVPGIVGGMLRHLHSLRRMKRDNGWIETLLEEAYNERMHLLTFLSMAKPGIFMKLMIIGAQGVFFNAMFISYLISPRTCHRFVGYLEEEAVLTYTRAIADIEAGKLPKWEDCDAPAIAVRYWNMPEGHQKMKDLLMYIRADEAKHREVNHTLGNLDQDQDPNPFVSQYVDPEKPHPGKGIEHIKPTGWERKDVI